MYSSSFARTHAHKSSQYIRSCKTSDCSSPPSPSPFVLVLSQHTVLLLAVLSFRIHSIFSPLFVLFQFLCNVSVFGSLVHLRLYRAESERARANGFHAGPFCAASLGLRLELWLRLYCTLHLLSRLFCPGCPNPSLLPRPVRTSFPLSFHHLNPSQHLIMLALRNTLRTTTTTFIRNATTLAASELPKSAPHEGVPFSAPPEDKTVGLLGQVFLPDMEKIEFVKVEGIKIVSTPFAGGVSAVRAREARGEEERLRHSVEEEGRKSRAVVRTDACACERDASEELVSSARAVIQPRHRPVAAFARRAPKGEGCVFARCRLNVFQKTCNDSSTVNRCDLFVFDAGWGTAFQCRRVARGRRFAASVVLVRSLHSTSTLTDPHYFLHGLPCPFSHTVR